MVAGLAYDASVALSIDMTADLTLFHNFRICHTVLTATHYLYGLQLPRHAVARRLI
jgi:hypothetical protein